MSLVGFKKGTVYNEQVPHRMGGAHSKRDPLLDEKMGSAKRHKASDGSDGVYYRETKLERDARVRAGKEQAKTAAKTALGAREDATGKLGGFKGLLKASRKPEEAEQAEQRHKDELESQEKAAQAQTAAKKSHGAREDVTGRLGGFKDRLKASRLPEEAEKAEKRHKDELEAEEKAALAKLAEKGAAAGSEAKAAGQSGGSSSSGATAPQPPDADEKVSFSEIWAEGDEESSADWLSGKGLKFHTTADKAFSMDQKKFKEAVEVFDPLENREAQADRAKKRNEVRMDEFRRAQKPAGVRKA